MESKEITIEKLKPCPVCGSSAVIENSSCLDNNNKEYYSYYVMCSNCHTRTQEVKTSEKTSPLQAITVSVSKWNCRVDEKWNCRDDDDDMEADVTPPKDKTRVTVRRFKH